MNYIKRLSAIGCLAASLQCWAPRLLFAVVLSILALGVQGCKQQSRGDGVEKVYGAEKDNVVLVVVGVTDGRGGFQQRGSGTGFLTKEGVVITASHVVGTHSGIMLTYRNVPYWMKPFYKDHANDIAFLYPVFAAGKPVNYDHLKGLSNLEIKEANPRVDEALILLGYPEGLAQSEPKRTLGSFKGLRKDRYMAGVNLYECDLPVMHGFSGGPVFTATGQLLGLAIGFEDQPNPAPYLVTYVAPSANLTSKIKLAFAAESMKKLQETQDHMPGFAMGQDNLKPLRSTRFVTENFSLWQSPSAGLCLNKKSASSEAAFRYGEDTKAVNLILDFRANASEQRTAAPDSRIFDVYVRYQDASNYVAIRVDLARNKACTAYAVKGEITERAFLMDMPVTEKSQYNLEVFAVNEQMGVYFDNIPVFYDQQLPLVSGQPGIFVSKGANVAFSSVAIRLPVDF